MALESALAFTLLSFIVGYFWASSTRLSSHRTINPELISRLSSIEQSLLEIQDRLKYLPAKPGVQEMRQFESAAPIKLEDVLRWPQGERLTLIVCSYYYPLEEPSIDVFEYLHEKIDMATQSKFGNEVQGYSRWSSAEEWKPYKFLANQEECTTSSCEGTIRRLL